MAKVFVDSADVETCGYWLSCGLVQGVTTNSSIIRRAGERCLTDIGKRLLECDPDELHMQVLSESPDEAYHQAVALADLDDRVRVKIPLITSKGELRTALIKRCQQAGLRVNVTACTSPGQGMAVAGLGVSHVSLLWCRMRDGGEDPAQAVEGLARYRSRAGLPTTVLVGSIRDPQDVTDAIAAGADIVTVPPAILNGWLRTDPSVELARQFHGDATALVL